MTNEAHLSSCAPCCAGHGQPQDNPGEDGHEHAESAGWVTLALSVVAALAAEIAHWMGTPWLVPAALSIGAVLACGLGTYREGWEAIRHGRLEINALMSIAVTGALILGQWAEAAMVMVLFTLAERIEAHSLDRARHAVESLMQLAPDRARVRQAGGQWADVAADSVAPGDTVQVRPGERIALDGQVTTGTSTVDQSPITGESLPVDKATGDDVYAGTINTSGTLEYQVSAAASDSTLSRIIQSIETAQASRAPTQRFVDRFARVYTPLVVVLAALIAIVPPLMGLGSWSDWVYKALVLLVIACPCALVISTPVSIVSGLAAAARHGILIKGGVHLEQGHKLRWLALDKTGTITRGHPTLTDSETLGTLKADRCHELASALATHSHHPVSQAIAQGLDLPAPASPIQFQALAGRGVQGDIDGQTYLLGNHRLIHERGLCSPALETRLATLEEKGHTVVLLSDTHSVLALYAVADAVKPESAQAIRELHDLGVQTTMLSGDNQQTVAAVAQQVGITRAEGNLLPDDKLQAVQRLTEAGATVGMVGDGINDAPALARASIGFAMGALGTDAAIETADVALMDDDLRKIPWFIRLSRATHRILVQNIAIALGLKLAILALTLAGLGTLWLAVFADVGASLLVVGNGLRLLRPARG